MVKEFIIRLMVTLITGVGLMVRKKGMEPIFGLMDEDMKVIGRLIS